MSGNLAETTNGLAMRTTLARRVADALADRPEAASQHVRVAIQVLAGLMEFGKLGDRDRQDLRVALHRLWLGLREVERGNV